MQSIYSFRVDTAKNEEVSLEKYKGKVLLIVNTASECGFTYQYEGLEKLHEKYGPKGFEVLGFPCNQFGGQESGSNEEIQSFCTGSFGVKFPVFAKIEVNGANAHPLYNFLKSEAPGLFGTQGIKWNFTKFLVSAKGEVLKRFAPLDKPESLEADIESEIVSGVEDPSARPYP
jgi:glutathione peroxidase